MPKIYQRSGAKTREPGNVERLSKIANWASLFLFGFMYSVANANVWYQKDTAPWSKQFFTGWVIVIIIWMFISSFIVVFGPLYEGRKSIWFVLKGLYWGYYWSIC